MHLKFLALLALAASTAVASSACSTPTTIESAWRDPDYSAAPLRKVFVLGTMHDQANRRSLEDHYVAALSQHGVQAVPSYAVFQQTRPDREQVRRYLESNGFDGALVTHFEGVQARTSIVPGADFYYGYPGWWGDDYMVETDQYLKVETSLWNPRTGKLIWSVATETENPTSAHDAINSIVTKITKSLANARLIPPGESVSMAYAR
jgi:hypothetical protein